MSHPSSSPPPPLAGYSPSIELLRAAEEQLAGATTEELAAAARAYLVHSGPAGGRSPTGGELPGFYMCPTVVRAGWLAVVRDMRARTPIPLAVAEPSGPALSRTLPALPLEKAPSAEKAPPAEKAPVPEEAPSPRPVATPRVTLPELCRSARDLAEAAGLLGSADTAASRDVARLVKSLSRRLREQMRQLASETATSGK
ncbi:hypothetical protein [Melittangium boletus]|uniref:hypothetical protein n=1 Tax=Melittangium boletus TaxID=83453 RepID=UPI003DA3B74C